MDLWVVAAVASAGYLATNWQNLSTGDKENSDELFLKNSVQGQSSYRNLLEQIRDKACPFRRLAQKREKRYVSSKHKDDVLDRNDKGSSARMAATSGSTEYLETEEYNVHQLVRKRSSEDMGFVDGDTSTNGNLLGRAVDEYNVHWFGRGYCQESVESVGADSSNHFGFNKSKSLRSRRRRPGYVIRPLDSLESCLAAQLCREHERVEEYVYSSLHSSSVPVLRPLLVTDGSRIISRASIDSSSLRSNNGEDKSSGSCLEGTNPFRRGPAAHYHDGESYELWLKPRIDCSTKLANSSGNRVSGRPFHLPGPHHRMILFFMGITIGILSILMASKREVEQLNKKLKQTQNLVQELSEELNMKDVLTVRELANEASQPQRVDDTALFHHEPSTEETLSSEQFDEISKYDGKKQNDPTVGNSEMRNNIEAELAAELERLELNLKASSLERISDHVEVDPDLEPAYYGVSPRELRLRLHEEIEAQLEARIEELEIALRSSESRLHSLESQRGFTYSEAELSSTPQSPMYIFKDSNKEEPLVINLAGNALDAYNEAYAEILSMTDSDKETAQALADVYGIGKETPSSGRKPSDCRSCWENESTSCDFVREDRISMSSLCVRTRTSGDQTYRSLRSSEKRNSDDEDNQELDILLIKRIVEKRTGANILVCGT